jgi:hypothetical protein
MFTLWSIFKAGLLVANAGVIPHKQRFLARCAAAFLARALGFAPLRTARALLSLSRSLARSSQTDGTSRTATARR